MDEPTEGVIGGSTMSHVPPGLGLAASRVSAIGRALRRVLDANSPVETVARQEGVRVFDRRAADSELATYIGRGARR